MANFFPDIGFVNHFFIGDNVLLEPAADGLAQSMGHATYVLTNCPEIFKAHPQVIGINGTNGKKPTDLRFIDVDDAMTVTKDKRKEILNASGLSGLYDRAPHLYLDAREHARAVDFRSCFHGPCIGIALGSNHSIKNWVYMPKLVKQLVRMGYNVFLIGSSMTEIPESLKSLPLYEIIGRELREAMIMISAMDVVVGPDTGPVHIAASQGVPTAVICMESFADLYEKYDKCVIFSTPQMRRKGINTVPVIDVLDAIEMFLAEKPLPRLKSGNHAFVRFRGLGDVLLSLPALATLRSLDGASSYTYITSPAVAKLLRATNLVDETVAIDYKHGTSGMPLLPQDVDYDAFDTVTNLINRIDFLPESGSVPRSDLFGKAMGVPEVDYSTDWRLHPPERWLDDSRAILAEHGVREADTVIGLQVDSKGASRIWPKARWVEFVGRARKYHYQVALLSDQRMNNVPSGAINLTGKLSIEEYVGVIALCSVFVGPDSSGVHIAGAMDIPAVGLFGSVDPYLRVNHYQSVRVIVGKAKCVPCNDWMNACCKDRKKFPMCMWSIKPKRVLGEVRKALRDNADGGS